MSVVNLYDSLQGTKTPNGTWSFIDGPVGAPSPPGAFNGTIDFSVHDYGSYIYRYTVTNGSCTTSSDLTIDYIELGTRINDACSGAKSLTYNNASVTVSGVENNSSSCPGLAAPTDSGVAAPATWGGVASYSGDLWYRFTVPLDAGSDPAFTVTVDGSAYGATSITSPLMAIYNGTCGSLNLIYNEIAIGQEQLTSTVLSTSGSADTFYIRVASVVTGRYTITLSGNLNA